MRWFGRSDAKSASVVFTTWTVVHTVAGLVMMLLFLYVFRRIYQDPTVSVRTMLLGLLAVNMVHGLYEAKDLIQSETKNPPYTVSWQNSLGDQACATLGAVAGGFLAGALGPASLIDVTLGVSVFISVLSTAFYQFQ